MARRYLTTGEAAQYCGVTLRTIINWIKADKLNAHQLPGTRKDNRISPDDLIAFMHRNKLPVPTELFAMSKPNNTTVLIVDDDEYMARAIKRCLTETQWHAHIALDGFEAGRMYEKLQPDVMTLDLQMPRLNGFELLEQLSERKKTRILVISAMEDHHLKQAVSLGADAVIRKPFENEQLLDSIKRLLDTTH